MAKGLCRCDEVKDLELRGLSVGPKCNDKCPCKWETEGDLMTEQEKAMDHGNRDWSNATTSQGV